MIIHVISKVTMCVRYKTYMHLHVHIHRITQMREPVLISNCLYLDEGRISATPTVIHSNTGSPFLVVDQSGDSVGR